MKRNLLKHHVKIGMCLLSVATVLGPMVAVRPVVAQESSAVEQNVLKYRLGEKINAGKDTGFSKNIEIGVNDPHYGWDIGSFFVSGYSNNYKDENGTPVFLKNVGDKVALYFNLEQDINKLNGVENLVIAEDVNGHDEYFQVPKGNFGKGMLIVRYTDYENVKHEPTKYENFLEATAVRSADTQVQLFEEGDYEVALDYEIAEASKLIGVQLPVLKDHKNYKIAFKFSVRNGNTMVYPFDVKTGDELMNSVVTENGFRLDLAKSRYLDINIKKEVLAEGANGLDEDTRYNRPAKDGETYEEEGIYTITATNKYTKQTTTKKIYVGSNSLLKAVTFTGKDIKEINRLLAEGAKVDENGQILMASNEVLNGSEETVTSQIPESQSNDTSTEETTTTASSTKESSHYGLVGAMIVAIGGIVGFVLYRRKLSSNAVAESLNEENKLLHTEGEQLNTTETQLSNENEYPNQEDEPLNKENEHDA